MRPRAASHTLSTTRLASAGFSSSQRPSASDTTCWTGEATSEETSFSLVWDENFGSGIFTDTMAVSPSRMSSPSMTTFLFFCVRLAWTKDFITLVMADLKPVTWVPRSLCGMLFVKAYRFSV